MDGVTMLGVGEAVDTALEGVAAVDARLGIGEILGEFSFGLTLGIEACDVFFAECQVGLHAERTQRVFIVLLCYKLNKIV
ncbi:MAG: hypothetical protein ACR2NN_00820 [Bryobacteraceae bacterium]